MAGCHGPECLLACSQGVVCMARGSPLALSQVGDHPRGPEERDGSDARLSPHGEAVGRLDEPVGDTQVGEHRGKQPAEEPSRYSCGRHRREENRDRAGATLKREQECEPRRGRRSEDDDESTSRLEAPAQDRISSNSRASG